MWLEIFEVLKKMFYDLLLKTNLHIFFHNVVVCNCMLHNLIFNGKDDDNKSLITQLKIENQIDQGTWKDEHIIAIGGNDLNINMFLYIIMRFLEQHNERNLSNIL